MSGITQPGIRRASKWKLTAEALALSERLRQRIDLGPRHYGLSARAWNRYVRRLSAFYASKTLNPSGELLIALAASPGVQAGLKNPNTDVVQAYPRGRNNP